MTASWYPTPPDGQPSGGSLVRLAAYRDLRATLRADVLDAHAAGATQAEIARASGLTRQWVAKILKDAPARAIEAARS